jgi:hypothetical protein
MDETLHIALEGRLKEVDDYIYRLERGLHLLARERAALVEALENTRASDNNRRELAHLGIEQALATLGVVEGKTERRPSLPEMILGVLAAAQTGGEGTLSPKEIASRIRARWGAPAPLASVGPVTWRLARAGKIQREAGLYRLSTSGDEPHA